MKQAGCPGQIMAGISELCCQFYQPRYLLGQPSSFDPHDPGCKRGYALGQPAPALLVITHTLCHGLDGGKSFRGQYSSYLCLIGRYLRYFLLYTSPGDQKCNPGNSTLQEVLHKQSRKGMLSCILYTLAIPVAYFSTAASGVLIIAVAVMWLIPDRNIEKVVSEN